MPAFASSPIRDQWAREKRLAAGEGGLIQGDDGWLLGDRFLPAEAAEALLLRPHPQIKAYLLFDPLDPEMAPWTAARED